MSDGGAVGRHYTHGSLLGAIRSGVEKLGKTPETVTIDDLAPIDEFHIGGRRASDDFLSQLTLNDGTHVLDVGCGLGGGSRFAANRFGCRVSGVDLTPEFIETGQELCEWVGLRDRINLQQGSALEMPFDDGSFDAAYMMHVGMNIADKQGLFTEVARVLKPGGVFGVYDVMATGDDGLIFPLPWAETPDTSAVATPEIYKSAFADAGLTLSAERDRRQFALEFFAELTARSASPDGPPPLGLHILMGANGPQKVKNMVENIVAGRIAPIEMVARK
ncbi:MAG: class I SAM-dependent methyltransferase [Alphaproteobacteria bacterium]|nr:class I SAM-dependent methyltransferase [Alphaproteobacteria bacterium]